MSIIRTRHDRENPFVQLTKASLWDPNLSLEAIGLWARILSRPDNWVIHVSELKKSCGIGENKAYRILNELIENGYAYRYQPVKDGRYQAWETHVFEDKHSKEEIKEMFTLRCFPDAEIPDAENGGTTNIDCTNSSPLRVEEEMIYKEGRHSPPPSADASGLTDHFLSKIKERSPQFRPPNLKKWIKEIDCLLRIDKRNLEECKKLIDWSATHRWWNVACLCPSKLRKCYDEMLLQMNAEKDQFVIRENRAYALKMKEKYPEDMKGLSFDEKYAMNRRTGKEVPFNLPAKQFKECLASLFGAQHVG